MNTGFLERRVRGVAQRVLADDLTQIGQELDTHLERIAELELALEDADWLQLNMAGETEFSRAGLRQITRLSRLMYLKNPLIQRGVNVKRYYVWGQGMTVKAQDEVVGEVLKAFQEDHKNQVELTSHQARMLKEQELETDGNLFFVLFPNSITGEVKVRSIPFDQIEDVVSNPEDAKEPWFYKRVWTPSTVKMQSGVRSVGEQQVVYYPDWRYTPIKKVTSIGGKLVRWDSPVYHVRVGGFSDWKFGLSEVYAAIDWAKAYKEFLEDVATLMRAYSRFAWKVSVKGGKKAVSAAKSKISTTYGNAGSGAETNPPPTAASTFIASENADLTPMSVRGATISPDDGRRLLLMVASAVGLPETFFGDTSVGNLATAESLDRPTELSMVDRQTLWADVHRNIIDYVLLWAAKAPLGALRSVASVKLEKTQGMIVEMLAFNEGVSEVVSIDFPSLLDRDVEKAMNAIVTGATLNGQQKAGTLSDQDLARMIMIALGEEDVEEKLAEMFPEGADDIEDETLAARQDDFAEALSEFRTVLRTYTSPNGQTKIDKE
ncbi:MAG: hypothetical protein DWQ07_14105 [Chloroflexi bacterium]|nr:MAG: hypothetical protein DWQ07_14105 [Chloroflexota bacterium]